MKAIILLSLLVTFAACGRASDRSRSAAPPPAPASTTAAQADALTGAAAIDLVGAHLTQNNVYPSVSQTCLNLAARGQRERGWIIEAFDGCSLTARKTHRSMGLWHIDSVTKKVRPLE